MMRSVIQRGFTLVEVLLVLALLALAGTVLVGAAGSLLARNRAMSPEEAVATVFQLARREAVLAGRERVLRFDEQQHRFAWADAADAPVGPEQAGWKVEFLRPNARSAVLIAGQRVETAPAPVLRFFPNGTCEPVRVQIRAAGGEARVLEIDPWTCAPGLEVKS